jgi:hypothetical protein
MLERRFRVRRAMASDGIKERLGINNVKHLIAKKPTESVPLPKSHSVAHTIDQPQILPVSSEVSLPAILAQNFPPVDGQCPPGMKLLNALERRAMLKVFNDKKEQLLAQLMKYPLRINNVSMLRNKMEVQKQLDGVEMLIDQMKKRYIFTW